MVPWDREKQKLLTSTSISRGQFMDNTKSSSQQFSLAIAKSKETAIVTLEILFLKPIPLWKILAN